MAGMGEAPDKEELGGARAQTAAGAVDNEAVDEEDALGAAAPLPLLPARQRLGGAARAAAHRSRRSARGGAAFDRPARRAPALRHAARSSSWSSTAGRSSSSARRFGRPLITALARLDGRPVGVLASDPKVYGGGLTADASDKLARFVDLCDQFRLPVVQPRRPARVRDRDRGRARGDDPPRDASLRRRLPGDGPVGLGAGPQGLRDRRRRPPANASRLNLRYAWPSGSWGSLPIAGGLEAAYRRELESADDPAALRAEIQARLDAVALALSHRRAIHDRGDHRPARHAAAALRLGRARARAGRLRGRGGAEGARPAA